MSNPTNALIDELASTKLFIEQKGEIFARSNLGSRAAEALRTQQVEIEQAESLMRAASDDATRLGTENQKLCLDLKCLEESTVDSKIAEAWEDRFHKEVDRSAETRRVLTGQLDELQTRCLEKDQQKLLLGRQIDELKEQHQWHRCEDELPNPGGVQVETHSDIAGLSHDVFTIDDEWHSGNHDNHSHWRYSTPPKV